MRFPTRAAFLCLASLASACSSTPTTTTGIVRPTLIGVAPSDVFPMAPCGSGSQDLHGYVASLHDVTPGATPDGGTPFELPSSATDGPTPCARVTTFSFVAVGRQYVADVDGYARSDLHAPVGQFDGGASVSALGSQLLLDPAGVPVLPDWTARCGYVPGGIRHVVSGTTRKVDGGDPDSGSPDGSVADASAADASAADASATDASAADASTADASTADGGAPQCIASEFQPGGVTALTSVTRYAVDCVDGVSVKLSSLQWTCGGSGGIDHFEMESSSGITSCAPVPCARQAVLDIASLTPDLDPPQVEFTVRAFTADGDSGPTAPIKQASCTVVPKRGLVVAADCHETTISPSSPDCPCGLLTGLPDATKGAMANRTVDDALGGLPRPGKVVRAALMIVFGVWVAFAVALNWAGVPDSVFYLFAGDSQRILHGELWRLFTAPLLHVPTGSISHVLTTLLGLFFFAPSLEQRWGSARLVRFLVLSGLIAYGLQMLVILVLPPALGHRLVEGPWFGGMPVATAIAVAWALTFSEQTVRLFFLIPVSSRGLLLFIFALSVMYVLVGAHTPEGLLAPFGGMFAGWLLGAGTPSPIRRVWLKLRMAQLDAEARRQNDQRKMRVRGSGLQVIEGGKKKDSPSSDDPRGPDGRWLN